MNSGEGNRCSHRLGFPIRKSPDHRLLASSRGLSQLTTSFIAYLRQGIHTHALSSLTIKSTLRHKCFFVRFAFTCSKCPSIFNCQRTQIANDSAIHTNGVIQTRSYAGLRNFMVGLGRIELPTSPLSGVRSS